MVNGFPELVYRDSKEDQLNLEPNALSIDLLRAVYRSPDLPLHVRMRAAGLAIPYECARLGITYNATESDFAALLDARIKRHQEAKLIEHQPQVETKPQLPRVPDRRFRRI